MASKEAVNGQSSFRSRLPFRANRQRTYIMPTGFGYAFGSTGLILFFLAVGYANNLIYIFVFLLISVAVTSIVITNRNVDALKFTLNKPSPVFAEEPASIPLQVENTKTYPLWDFEFLFQSSPELSHENKIAEKSAEVISVPFSTKTRGPLTLPRLIIRSSFPFGLFRAWKVQREMPTVLVYPARKGQHLFPSNAVGSETPQTAGLFRDLRPFQSADSTMRIDWRASARRQELLIKTYEEGDKPLLHFHWQQTSFIHDSEQRLSQLALWVDEAEKRGHEYSLDLGTKKLAMSRGRQHHHECLEMLALAKTETLS